MILTTGTGKMNWEPAAPLGISDGTITLAGDEEISGQFTYGALGACQGGSLMLADVPDAWRTAVRDRLITVSMSGQPVFRGLLDQVSSPPGQLSTVGLLRPHEVYMDAPGGSGQTLEWPGLTAGSRNYLSVGQGQAVLIPEGQTRKTVIEQLLAPYPTAEFGVGPDLYAAIGRPENAAYLTHALGSLEEDLEISPQGYSIPDYLTDVLYDPGPDWAKVAYSRAGVPALTPRRSATISVDSVKTKGRGTVARLSTNAGYVARYSVDVPADTPSRRITNAVMRVSGTVNLATPEGTVNFYASAPGGIARFNTTPAFYGVLQTGEIPVAAGDNFIVTYSFDAGPGGEVRVSASGVTLSYDQESPRDTASLQRPPGWFAPFSAGPVFQVRLPGWHVPPIKLTGLPGGLNQMVAGSTVTWNRGEVSSLLTTVAWPYQQPGPRGRR